ncbi:MAG: transglycosylase SLT domain-containing protein [Proteobacteria bacterium]|nr:transglycosylase SLT domain-containing protein [Pseudomonadota bacterium]
MKKKLLLNLVFTTLISTTLFAKNVEGHKKLLRSSKSDAIEIVSLDFHNHPQESRVDQSLESDIRRIIAIGDEVDTAAEIPGDDNWQIGNVVSIKPAEEPIGAQDINLAVLELPEIDANPGEVEDKLAINEDIVPDIQPNQSYHIPNIPLVENKRVKAFIKMYTHRKREVFEQAIARSPKYMKMIHRIFKEYELPLNLAYLAVVESNFNPNARSRARATGLWQFMGYTGKVFGLNRSWWHDDRYDPERATVAAAQYLKQLHKQFKGDWELALAAYNTGGGRVRREMRKAKKRKKPQNFWSLRLPRETRGYVPAFYAVATIFSDLETYGFNQAPEPNSETLKQVANVPGGVSLKQVATLLKTDLKKLSKLNPRLKRGITPAIYKEFEIAIPLDVAIGITEYKKLSLHRKQFWKYYKIRKGESLWSLSRKFQIPIRKIKSFNQMRGSFLRIGQKIMLPLPSDWAPKKYKKSYRPPKPATIAGLNYVHVVEQGDTLWSISTRFNLSMRNIKKWNRQVLRSRFLKIGTQIRLKLPVNLSLAI